jgi:hypothetical protein
VGGGSGPKAGEVRPCIWLGEELTPHVLARAKRREPTITLGLGAVGDQDGADQLRADEVELSRDSGAGALFCEEDLLSE